MSEDVSMQLSCYAMYAMDKWGVDPENVKLIEYNLLGKPGRGIHHWVQLKWKIPRHI